MHSEESSVHSEDLSISPLSQEQQLLYERNRFLERENSALKTEIAEYKLREIAVLGERDQLLKEVHHRVKNNLQIILSLMNLQQEAYEGREAEKPLRRSYDRILSMALLYDQLYTVAGFAGVDLRSYCEDLVNHLILESGRTDVRVEFAIEPLPEFGPDRMLPFGLILAELVSNSLLHGSSGPQGGRLSVTLKRTDGASVEFTVRDNGTGGGSGVFQSADSLGLRLIETLSAQLGGRPVYCSGDEGFSCSMVLPVPAP